MRKGINSRVKVKEFGEVFTPDNIVNDMLDLIDREGAVSTEEYINRTYLEPACGDGQFLIRILSRKLERVTTLPLEGRKLGCLKALCSIYGIDIQAVNVEKCRERMKDIILGKGVTTFTKDGENTIKIDLELCLDEEFIRVVDYVLEQNIQCGNFLGKYGEAVTLKEYTFTGENVEVKDYSLNNLEIAIEDYGSVHYMNLDRIEASEFDPYADF